MERRLNQPYLPQMSDGVITQGDLETQNTIFVIILRYGDVSKDDFIVLHFGDLPVRSFEVEDPDQETVATFTIDADSVPDGDYLVWYEVKDALGNDSGPSPSGWAVVNMNDSGVMEAPVFSDADGNHEIDDSSVQMNNGTHVAVPAYTDITAGDRVSLLFYVTSADGNLIENSQYTVSHLIQGNEVQSGFTVLIPAPYVTVPDGRNCHARYSRSPAGGGTPQYSLTADAFLTLGSHTQLPAPTFIDALYGWLTPEQVADGIRVQAAWPDIAAGNYVDMLLTGFAPDGTQVSGASASQSRTVTADEAAQGRMIFTFSRSSADAVHLGRLSAGYTVDDRMSVIGSVGVDMTMHAALTPPVFTQAEEGWIEEGTITQDNGAPVRMSWPEMTAGDTVTLYISGHDAGGHNVPGATVVLPAVVNEQNIADNYVTLRVPPENALAPSERGTLTAQYTIDFYNNQGIAVSPSTEVMLMNSQSSGLTLVLATGAPVYDETLAIRPRNNGKVFGPAGLSVTLSCSTPAVFTTSESNTLKVTLNQGGEAAFAVQSTATGEITVLAVDIGGGQQASQAMFFSRYHAGTNTPQIHAWGESSGSVADGDAASTIYVITENQPSLTRVHARVTQGNAILLETGDQDGELLLNADKSVAIELVDSIEEDIIVQISLPESSGNVMDVPLHFVASPVRQTVAGEQWDR